MKLIKKILYRLALLIMMASLILAGMFYVLIAMGQSPKLQVIWVTTAMTTLDHKWLATSFIPADTIDRILKENAVDDSEYNSIRITPAEEERLTTAAAKKKYEAEGYRKLEGGVYIKDVEGENYHGYLLLIPDPKRVSLVDTPKQGIQGSKVISMVKANGGIAGVNGGGFCDGANYDSNGGTVAGLLITEEQGLISPAVPDNTGYYNMIGLDTNGSLVLQHETARWALDNGIKNAVSFKPFLIVNGEGVIKSGTGGWGIAPRTGIGQRGYVEREIIFGEGENKKVKTVKDNGEIIFLVIDGRQPGYSIGADIRVVQDELLEEGCINAALLDGGSSSVMAITKNDELTFANKPSLGHERLINNCFIIKPEI